MKNQANMPAAHNTPTTLAVATLRSRNRRSGISGALTRASITRNAASSTTAAPSRPSVCTERPAGLVAVDDRVHREHQRRGDGDGAGDVEALAARWPVAAGSSTSAGA